jgi:cytidylate kinase
MIITIDGPVATGKSTVAKKLAESIGFIYFDTGAMYRMLTYGVIKHNVDLNNPQQLTNFLDSFRLDIKVVRHERHYFFEDEDITSKIRWAEVTSMVSIVSSYKPIRDKLVAIQRELSEGVNAVFEGRDMGTVVFPDATLKIYLTGRPEIRAKRRFQEFQEKYPNDTKDLTLEQCLIEITQRDTIDSKREHSPLHQAKDAFIIDTSDLTLDEIVYKILEHKDSVKSKRTGPK